MVTRMAAEDQEELTADLRRMGVRVRVRHSDATTVFVNRYDSEKPDVRTLSVESVAGTLAAADVSGRADGFVFGPLTRRDVDPGCVRAVSKEALCAIDVQGLVRTTGRGIVELRGNPAIAQFVENCSVAKASLPEALVASGTRSVSDAIDWFISRGVAEVLITFGADGSIVATADGVTRIPAYSAGEVVDATGCGDVALSAYVVNRFAGETPTTAARIAAAAAGIAATDFGVPALSRRRIETLLLADTG